MAKHAANNSEPMADVNADTIASDASASDVSPVDESPNDAAARVADASARDGVPSIPGAECAVRVGYFERPCPRRRTYRGTHNGGPWYECDVCGAGEVGPEP